MSSFPSSGFQPWNTGHQDIILSTAWDYHGQRLATASSDQTIRVWEKRADRENSSDSFLLIDSWQAHSGEITKVKFVSPYSSHLCTLSTDCSLKIWAEDVLAPLQSGCRYLCIVAMRSETKLPFTSVDFKCIPPGVSGFSSSTLLNTDPLAFDQVPEGAKIAGGEQYMVVTTADGFLTVYESGEPTDMSNRPLSIWSEIFRTYLQFLHRRFLSQSSTDREAASGAYTLASESSFQAVFDPSPLPCYSAIGAGLPRHSLGLAVVAMNSVFILRTDNSRSFYLAARLDSGGAPGSLRADILRDVAWAPGNVRGYDLIAAAGKGGWVWVWALRAEPLTAVSEDGEQDGEPPTARRGSVMSKSSTTTAIQNIVDSDGEFTAADKPADPEAFDEMKYNRYGHPRSLTTSKDRLAGKIRHFGELIAELKHPSATWTCEWNLLGDVLITTADDAIARTWKQAIDGEWLECGCVET